MNKVRFVCNISNSITFLYLQLSTSAELLRRKARAIEQKNVEELAQLCRKLGDMYHENHNYNAALQHYQEEAKAYQSLDMKVKASQAFRMVGEMYILLQNFGEALNYVMKYLGMFKKF